MDVGRMPDRRMYMNKVKRRTCRRRLRVIWKNKGSELVDEKVVSMEECMVMWKVGMCDRETAYVTLLVSGWQRIKCNQIDNIYVFIFCL